MNAMLVDCAEVPDVGLRGRFEYGKPAYTKLQSPKKSYMDNNLTVKMSTSNKFTLSIS